MVRQSSMNQTTALVRFPFVWSSRSTNRFVIVQKRRALAIDLFIGLGLPILNMILCASTPLYSRRVILTHNPCFSSLYRSRTQVRHLRRRRMLPGHRQHHPDIPPRHPLASLHRTRRPRLHIREPFLHPTPPSLSRLLDGMHTLFPPYFFLILPPRRTGSHHVRVNLHGRHSQPGLADHRWVCGLAWVGSRARGFREGRSGPSRYLGWAWKRWWVWSRVEEVGFCGVCFGRVPRSGNHEGSRREV